MPKIIHQANDKFFKQSMRDIRVAQEFFQTHLPTELLEKIDLSTLKLEKHSFIDETYKNSEADVVYSVTVGATLAYFYLLCEQQTEIDQSIAFRLLVYTVRLMELHLAQHPKSSLPLIYPLVIYTGDKPWNAPRDIFGLFGEQEDLARALFLQPYQLIEVRQLADETLRQQRWAGLIEFVLKYQKVRDLSKFLEVVFPWLHEVANQDGSQFAKAIIRYIIDGIEEDDEKVLLQKTKQYLSGELRGEAMTLAQRFEQIGMQKGIQQGEYSLVIRLLEHKFKNISPHLRQRLALADAETLLHIGERILDAKKPEDIFE